MHDRRGCLSSNSKGMDKVLRVAGTLENQEVLIHSNDSQY